ncbi:MAG TPA: efflux RND transporter periplasmic adaptor subunit [Candidatus Omnitrophota bacterium]|nr:efflux RND transporter periplasmic adaptor subunit [Candidatus Omnitrophota bacterium]
MNLKRWITLIVVVVVALTIFRIGYRIATGKKVQETRPSPVLVQNPKIGNIAYKEILTADLKGQKEVSVRPRTAGRVEQIFVNEGDYVEKGEKMLSFATGISEQSDIYEDMIVRAPISGIVGMKMIKEGDQVGGSPGSYNPVFTLYDIDNVKINADVPEKDYGLLRIGTPAEIVLDAFPDRVFRGSVGTIRPVIDPLSRTTQVEIVLPNPGHKIKPGMFGKVSLVLKQRTNVLLIPFDAVLGENEKYVFVSSNGAAVKKTVTLGMQQEDQVEVISGLTAADRVITLGQRVVKEGSAVTETKE